MLSFTILILYYIIFHFNFVSISFLIHVHVHVVGKELRLKQQYFWTAASLSDIMRRFKNLAKPLEEFSDCKQIFSFFFLHAHTHSLSFTLSSSSPFSLSLVSITDVAGIDVAIQLNDVRVSQLHILTYKR